MLAIATNEIVRGPIRGESRVATPGPTRPLKSGVAKMMLPCTVLGSRFAVKGGTVTLVPRMVKLPPGLVKLCGELRVYERPLVSVGLI